MLLKGAYCVGEHFVDPHCTVHMSLYIFASVYMHTFSEILFCTALLYLFTFVILFSLNIEYKVYQLYVLGAPCPVWGCGSE